MQRNDALSQRQIPPPISSATATTLATATSSLSRAEAMRGRVSRSNSKEDAPFVVERTGDHMEAKTLPKLAKYDIFSSSSTKHRVK